MLSNWNDDLINGNDYESNRLDIIEYALQFRKHENKKKSKSWYSYCATMQKRWINGEFNSIKTNKDYIVDIDYIDNIVNNNNIGMEFSFGKSKNENKNNNNNNHNLNGNNTSADGVVVITDNKDNKIIIIIIMIIMIAQ